MGKRKPVKVPELSQDELERLRAALQKIIDLPWSDPDGENEKRVAREALNQ